MRVREGLRRGFRGGRVLGGRRAPVRIATVTDGGGGPLAWIAGAAIVALTAGAVLAAARLGGARTTGLRVRDVMVDDVVTIEPSASLVDAARRMRDANVGVLPVVERDQLRAVLTDRDLVVRAMARQVDPASTRVRDCATRSPVSARPDWSVDEAMRVMADHQVGRLPVIDDRNRVVGMVTLGSLALRGRTEAETLRAAQKVSQRSARA